MHVIKGIKVLMYYILKDTILLDYQQNSMQFKLDNIQQRLPKKISNVIVSNWIKWVFPLIGVGKYVPQKLIFTNGLSGFFYFYLIIIIVKKPIKHSQYHHLFLYLKRKEIVQ